MKPNRNPRRKPLPTRAPAPRLQAQSLAWLVPALLMAAAALRLARHLSLTFYNDDFVFLDAASRRSWPEALLHPLRLGGYLRPFSRDIHFKLMGDLAGMHSLPYHAVNLALLLGCTLLVWALGRRLLDERAAAIGAALFAFGIGHAVLVGWISGCQDLWALWFALGSALLWVSGRSIPSAALFALALLSKESVAPLPLALLLLPAPGAADIRERARRAAPHLAILLAWGALALAFRTGATSFEWDARSAALLPWRFLLSAAGVEDPGAWVLYAGRGLRIQALAGAALAAGAVFLSRPGARHSAGNAFPWFAWAALGLLPILPVSAAWSSYYFAFPLAGLCLGLGALASRLPLAAACALPVAVLLAGEPTLREPFAQPGSAEAAHRSRVSVTRLELGSAVVWQAMRDLPAQLRGLPPRSLLVFNGLSIGNGLISGDGPAMRLLSGDPTLAAAYLGELGDSTDFSRPLFLVSYDADAGRFRSSDLSGAAFADLKFGLELSGRPRGARAACRHELQRPGADAAWLRWNLGYLDWQAGDTLEAARNWRIAAGGAFLEREEVRSELRRAMDSEGGARVANLATILERAPTDTLAILTTAREAHKSGNPLGYVLYFRAARLNPASLGLLREARAALVHGSTRASVEILDEMIGNAERASGRP